MNRTAPRAPAKPSRHTFDVVEPPNLAPRVAHHDARLRSYDDRFIPEDARVQVPLDAFGPVTSLARQRYFTHDNGGRPYLVRVDPVGQRATVRRNLAPGKSSRDFARHVVTYDKLVKRIDYTRFWNGYAPFNYGIDYDVAIGNTLLFETEREGRRRYILVAGVVYAFELPDGHPPLAYFCAPIGNNDVPYPYGWSERYAYFLTTDSLIQYTPLEHLAKYVKTGDLASFFYDQRDWQTGAFTDDLTKKQRAALVPMPREMAKARIIHSKNAG
jgi:hypothetical protein